MPIYEYQCKECKQLFEEWRRHVEDEDAVHACPICKGEARRLISNTSFALKGGGWYVTDYGSHKNRQDESAPACAQSESCTSCEQAKSSDCAACPPVAPSAAAS